MKIKPMYLVAIVVVVVAVVAGAVILTSDENTDSQLAGTVADNNDGSNRILPLINQARCSAGLHPLVVNSILIQAADRHNKDMINTGNLSHTGSDGSSPSARMEAAGYDWQTTAENIASGQTTVEDVFQSWMNSSGHRANMLKADVQELGLAYGVDAGGKPYWTLNVGRTFDGITVPSC